MNPDFPYFARGSSMAFGGVGLTQIEQFTYQAHAFLQQVAGVTPEQGALPPCASFTDGYREMLLADAVARSAAAGGTAVDVTDLPELGACEAHPAQPTATRSETQQHKDVQGDHSCH